MTERTLMNHSRTAVGVDTVFLTPDGVDVASSSLFQITRRRVLFDDVSFVTIHHERGVAFLVATGAFGTFFTALAIFIVAVSFDTWPMAVPFLLIGFPLFVAFLLRLAMGRSVVTVFGRRSRATLRFGIFRSARAREVYGQLCSAVRRAQNVATGFSPSRPESPAPPLPADVPLPPPAQ
jgi:hypothetical protein